MKCNKTTDSKGESEECGMADNKGTFNPYIALVDMEKASSKEVLERYTILSMRMQEEYLNKPQDFGKQKMLNDEFVKLKQEILKRMGENK